MEQNHRLYLGSNGCNGLYTRASNPNDSNTFALKIKIGVVVTRMGFLLSYSLAWVNGGHGGKKGTSSLGDTYAFEVMEPWNIRPSPVVQNTGAVDQKISFLGENLGGVIGRHDSHPPSTLVLEEIASYDFMVILNKLIKIVLFCRIL